MSAYRSELLATLEDRGYIHQVTDPEGLDALAREDLVVAYAGFDCTAPSLHVGHLFSLMTLRRLQQAGHKPIILIGGGTTKIGDPTFKDESRPLLSDEEIAANIDGILGSVQRLFAYGDGPTDALLVNNAEWLDRLEYIPFLRDYGRHFTINRMLTFDSVRLRLEREQPMTFLEFNYMLLQAYDYLELNRRYGCRLQSGGSDQWGNIVNGIELGRRVDGVHLFGLTTPLLTTASGQKMGKTESGAVWLNPDMLSPWDYWQYWRNVEDADVGRFLRLFTDLPLDEIARLESLKDREINEAKKVLATEATALLHGRESAEAAADTARQTFEAGESAAGLPTITVDAAEVERGLPAFELFRRAGLCKSNGEARRLIKGGGARLNDEVIPDEAFEISGADFGTARTLKLSAGKKRHALVRTA